MTTPVTLEELQTAYDILDRLTNEEHMIPDELEFAGSLGFDLLLNAASSVYSKKGTESSLAISLMLAVNLLPPLQDYIDHKRKEN